MSTVRVKVCGLTTDESVRAAMESGADFIGFVFFSRSSRHVTSQEAARLCALAPNVPAVAVTVDMPDAEIQAMLEHFNPAYLQLHGHESPARVLEVKTRFGIPVIKAISVESGDDIASAHAFSDVADMLLFDARAPKGLPGGNGLAFDWQLLANRKFSKPWFLSGGLNINNVEEALRISGAELVDVSSSLETAPGVKSPELIQKFLDTVKCQV